MKSQIFQHAALLPVYYILFIFPRVNAQPEPTPLTSPCPVVLPTNSRIVGGTLAQSPYMVSFRTTTGSCSGTLISQTDILTARHCKIDSSTLAFISSTNGSDGTLIPIASAVSHPRDDIMVVFLESPANVEPVKILANSDLPSAWSFVRAQGYGTQSGLPFPSDSRQRFVDIPVIPPDICEEVSEDISFNGVPLSQDPAFPDDYVCTGYLQSSSCTFCSGDSGGAVFGLLRGDPVLLGVISKGNVLCAVPGSVGISLRVSSYIDWLDEQDVQYDAVTELSETFVNAEGVNGAGNSAPREPINKVDEEQVGLAPGTIAGIAVGAGAAVVIVLLTAVFFVMKRRNGDEIDPPPDPEQSASVPATTGSPLIPPSQPGQMPGPNNLPSLAPTDGIAPGSFVPLAQPSQQPPQVPVPAPESVTQPLVQPQSAMQHAPQPSQSLKQQTMPVAYLMPTAQSPTQTALQPSQPLTQQTTPAVYPMPTTTDSAAPARLPTVESTGLE